LVEEYDVDIVDMGRAYTSQNKEKKKAGWGRSIISAESPLKSPLKSTIKTRGTLLIQKKNSEGERSIVDATQEGKVTRTISRDRPATLKKERVCVKNKGKGKQGVKEK